MLMDEATGHAVDGCDSFFQSDPRSEPLNRSASAVTYKQIHGDTRSESGCQKCTLMPMSQVVLQ